MTRNIEPAPFSQRLSAAAVELLVLALVWLLSLPILAIFLMKVLHLPLVAVGIGAVTVQFVLTLGEFIGSAGIGKGVAGLRLARYDDQAEVSPARRMIRYALKYLPLLLFAGFGAAGTVHWYLYGPFNVANRPFTVDSTGELLLAIAVGVYAVAWSMAAAPPWQSVYDLLLRTAVYDAADLTRQRMRRQQKLQAFEVTPRSAPPGI